MFGINRLVRLVNEISRGRAKARQARMTNFQIEHLEQRALLTTSVAGIPTTHEVRLEQRHQQQEERQLAHHFATSDEATDAVFASMPAMARAATPGADQSSVHVVFTPGMGGVVHASQKISAGTLDVSRSHGQFFFKGLRLDGTNLPAIFQTATLWINGQSVKTINVVSDTLVFTGFQFKGTHKSPLHIEVTLNTKSVLGSGTANFEWRDAEFRLAKRWPAFEEIIDADGQGTNVTGDGGGGQTTTPHLVVTGDTNLAQGQTKSLFISLSSAPQGQIAVALNVTNGGSINRNILYFDATNWMVPQEVLVTALQTGATTVTNFNVNITSSIGNQTVTYTVAGTGGGGVQEHSDDVYIFIIDRSVQFVAASGSASFLTNETVTMTADIAVPGQSVDVVRTTVADANGMYVVGGSTSNDPWFRAGSAVQFRFQTSSSQYLAGNATSWTFTYNDNTGLHTVNYASANVVKRSDLGISVWEIQ